jgi:hypothetical protein
VCVGNLSVKDIKAADEFERLIQPVGEFVAYIRQQNMKAVHPYMHANNTDTVGRTYGRFAATVRLLRQPTGASKLLATRDHDLLIYLCL